MKNNTAGQTEMRRPVRRLLQQPREQLSLHTGAEPQHIEIDQRKGSEGNGWERKNKARKEKIKVE